jgi:D-alanyl-lipoteichoic acid acyltransferase DltB (MBOAT superfamily)
MNYKKARVVNILISIFFALAMLISSYFIADKDLSETVIFILIAIWLVPFLYLSKKIQRK